MDERDYIAMNKDLNNGSEDKNIKIKLSEYGYHCGDGCCYNYGTITTVNDVELPSHNQDTGTIVKQILEHLGYNVEVIYDEDIE